MVCVVANARARVGLERLGSHLGNLVASGRVSVSVTNKHQTAALTTQRHASLTVTVPEAARLLGIGRNSAYLAAKSGQLPTIRIGHRVLVPRAALESMVSGATSAGYPSVPGH